MFIHAEWKEVFGLAPSAQITALNPENNGETFEPAMDKSVSSSNFYELPDELKAYVK